MDLLIEDGLLTEQEVCDRDWGEDPRHVDYGKLYENRLDLLKKAAERGWMRDSGAVAAFTEKNASWLPDYAPNFTLTAEDIHTDVTEVVKAAKKLVDLIGADFIVSVGRGISKDVEGGIKLAEELADVLGGVVGGSRATIDSGWLSADHQVGQTGKTVHPKVYIALGISGAIQHKAGMQDSECIIAVNKNDTAPIFEIADYGICGDLFKVTPMLIEAIKAAKAAK